MRSPRGLIAASMVCVVCASVTAWAQVPPVSNASTCAGDTPAEQTQHGWQAQAQGHWVEAETCLRAVLDAPGDHWVRHHRYQIERSFGIVEQHVGGLQVLGGVPGARVVVEGTELARLPMEHPVRVEATTLLVQVSADGYRTTERRVDVAAGAQPRVETIALVHDDPPAQAPVVTVAPPVVVPPPVVVTRTSPRVVAAPAVVVPAPQASSTMRTLAWVSGVGAVAGIALGIGGYAMGSSAASDYNTMYLGLACPGQNVTNTGACQSDLTRGSTAQALEAAGFVTGGVLAVASVVLFAVSAGGHPAATTEHARFGCGAGPGTVGVGCGGSF